VSSEGRPVAFVTGASRGIGKATAIELAAAGFDVAISARTVVDGAARLDSDRSVVIPGGLDTTQAAVEQHGADCLAVPMDLLDRASVDAAVGAVLARFGRVDVLVNNAIYQGSGTLARFVDLHEADLRRILEGNVVAQLAIIRALLPGMIARGSGTIVNLVSGAGVQAPPAPVGHGGWSLGYALSKAAFGRVAPLLHIEHGDQGIRVFSVDPGLTITERMEATGTADQYRRHFKGATPDVIARAIRWLATDPASDALRGAVVDAQREVAARGLVTPPTRSGLR
jgi:NAD(P)-dependent dehydrogenase (short-subunit alcohol dehydrogenase family)